MKSVAISFAIVASLTSVAAFADDPAALATQAAASYAQRDYNAPGVKAAQTAADLYAQAAAASADSVVKATNLKNEAQALFFVGDATADKTAKLAALSTGLASADQAVKILGIPDVLNAQDAAVLKLKASLPAASVVLLADALYERGINLGDWGQANGVMQSLSKWPELRRNMEIIITLGQESIENYGADRVLGRGYYKIPSLLGGDMNKALSYLTKALNNTKAPGQVYSVNGFNNIYYADVLHSQGNDDDATALLTAFINADPTKVDPTSIPETRQNQKDAADDMNGW